MLCCLAERVRNAVRVFRMLMSRLSRDWHADVVPHRLPGGNSGIAEKEQQQEQHIDAEAAAPAAVIVAARTATALALILRRPEGSPHPEEPPQAASRRVEGTRAKSPTPAIAVIIAAAGVAGRATRAPRALSADPLIQKANLPAAPAASTAAAAVAAVSSILAALAQGSGPRP
jgi:hypothetical protein